MPTVEPKNRAPSPTEPSELNPYVPELWKKVESQFGSFDWERDVNESTKTASAPARNQSGASREA